MCEKEDNGESDSDCAQLGLVWCKSHYCAATLWSHDGPA